MWNEITPGLNRISRRISSSSNTRSGNLLTGTCCIYPRPPGSRQSCKWLEPLGNSWGVSMISGIGWQLVTTHSHVKLLDLLTSNTIYPLLLYVSLSSGTRTSMGATFLKDVSQPEQNLLSPCFSALLHKIQPFSPHL